MNVLSPSPIHVIYPGPSYAPVGFEVADCDVAAASWEAVFDLVKGICRDPLRASGFCSCGWVRAAW
jgi:hypothetical protein